MGKQRKQWQTLFSWALRITADGDCSHEIKRRLLLGRKVMTNLDSILKSRDISSPKHYFADKGPSSQGYHFTSGHVWMWELDFKERWVLKNWCFCNCGVGEDSWESRRSHQSILKKINPEYSLEGLMLKLNTLATWCEELTHLKRPWCWERLRARGEGGDRGRDDWIISPTQWTWIWANSGR